MVGGAGISSNKGAPGGAAFKLRVYSRKWGHDDTYTVRRTDLGWHIQFINIGGQCDASGKPYLFENLEHDGIECPSDLGLRMQRLWREAPMMSNDEVQARLEVIAAHLRSYEMTAGKRARPRVPKAQ